MKVVSYQGPRTLRLDERVDPELAPGEVRLRVEACGVCGTDVRIYKGEHSAYEHARGRVPGHEIVGRVVEIASGDLVEQVALGDRVFVAPNLGCGACAQCASGNENLCRRTEGIGITRDGAFADHLVVPSRAVERGNLIHLHAAVESAAATVI